MARMSLDTAIRLSAEVKGGANITKVQRSLQDLAKGSQTTARDMDALRTATAQYARASEGSIAGIRNSIGAFRGLQEQAKIGSREFKQYGSEVQRLEGKLRGLEGAARRANPALDGLGAAAGRLIAAYAGIETVRFVFGKTAELEAQTRSLEVLTGSADRAKQIVQELQQLGAVTPFTSAELIDTAKRLQAFGVEAENVVDITRRLADVSGATGAELAGLATAYGQVQAKGRLQGEELLQFQERGVALQQVLRKEYGLSGAEFQKALEGGKISAEAVEYALKKLTDSGGKYANGAIAQSDTLNGRLSTLQDSIQMLAQAVGSALTPTFKDFLNIAIAGVSELQNVLKAIQLTAFDTGDWINEAMNFGDRFGFGAGYQAYAQRRQSVATARAALLTGGNQGGDQQSARPPAARNRPSGAPPLSGAGDGKKQSVEDRIAAMPFGREIIAAAKANSVDPALYAALVGQESGFNQRAVSRSGAIGLSQLMPGTARELGVNPRDPMQNLMGGAKYLRQQMDRFGLEGGLRAYNQGPGAQQRTPGGNSRESREYPGKVLARYRQLAGEDENTAGLTAEGMKAQSDAEAKLRESQKEQQQAAKGLLDTESNRLQLLQIADPLQKQVAESMIKQLTVMDEYGKRLGEAKSDEERKTLQQAKQTALQANALDLERSLTDAREEALKPLNDAVKETGDRLAYEREYGGLLEKGINPELARQYIEIDRIAEASKTALELQIAKLEAMAAELPIADELRKKLEDQVRLARELLGLIPGAASGAKGDAKEEDEAKRKREKDQTEAEAKAERLKNLYQGINSTIEEGIVGSMQAGIDSLIDGTKRLDESLKEILSGVIKDIANQLLRFAINTGLKAIGNKDGGLFSFAGGGYTGSSPRAGGIDGQGGFPAILHPQETVIDHTRMMPVPYQKGAGAAATSEQIVPYQSSSAAASSGLTVPFQSGGTALAVPFLKGGGTGDGGNGMAASIDVKFETVRIGEMDFVTRDEAQRIGRESAQRGAELASKRYRNNPDARRRDGIR